MARILNTDNSTTVSKSAAEKAADERRIAMATAKPTTANTSTKAKHENTAKVLSHLFDSNPNKKEAYVKVKNRSKCPITVTFSGNTTVNLSVPANGENHTLVPKGNTRIFSMVCGAQYQKTKNISGDYEMILGSR